MYLVDTNVLLEVLLEQERADEAAAFLSRANLSRGKAPDLHLTDFSLYSLGIILHYRGRGEAFKRVVADLDAAQLQLIRLSFSQLTSLEETIARFRLDFDDAYQYAAAERYDLTMVSFDADFDRTERGRKTPADVLDGLA